MRVLKKCFLYTFSLLIVIIAITLFALTTRPGLVTVVTLAEKFSPGELEIGSAHGNLLHSLNLENIRYTDEGQSINIKRLKLTWRLTYLLEGRIYIPSLMIDQIRITTTNTNEKPSSDELSLPEISLPIQFTVNKLTLSDININNTLVDKVNFSGESHDNTININTLDVSALDAHVKTKGTINLNAPLSVALNTTVQVNVAVDQTLHASIDLEGSSKKIALVVNTEAPFNANIHATLKDALTDASLNLTAHWENIVFIPEKGNRIRSHLGDLRFSGNLDDYELDFKADIAGNEIPKTVIATNAKGDSEKASLGTLIIETLGGTFTGHANLTWKPILTWEAVLNAEHINPGTKWHDIPGNINFNITSAGRKESTLLTHTSVTDFQGSLRNFDIDGNANISTDDTLITLTNTHFNLDDASITINGDLLKRWNFNWDIAIPNMYALTPYGSGSITTKGSVKGDTDSPNIELTANVNQLSVQEAHIKQLSINGNVDLAPGKTSTLSAKGNTFRYREFILDNLSAAFKGTTEKHQFDAAVSNHDINLNASITAGYDQEKWVGQITQLDLSFLGARAWKLDTAADFIASKNLASLSTLTLRSDNQEIILHGDWDNTQKLNATFDLNNFSLSQFKDSMPEGLSLHGSTELHAKVTRENEASPLIASLIGNLTPGWIEYPVGEEEHKIAFDGGHLNANLDSKGLQSELLVNVDDKTPIDIQFALPKLNPLTEFDLDQPVVGKINLSINNLNIIPTLSTYIKEARGTINSDLTVAGTLNKPEINGAITLNDGRLTLPSFGLNITDMNLSLTSRNDYTLLLNGTMKSGDGDLTLKSEITPAPDNLKAVTSITGTNLQVMNTKEYAIVVSPKLTLDYSPEKLTLGGNVDLIQADIRPRDFSSTQSLPDNVTYKGVEKKEDPFKVDGDVTVNILNPIHFRMSGLDANIFGKLKVTLIPEGAPLGNGELNVTKGSYKAYGQDLTISKAQFIYNQTPISNPAISIRAIRKVKVVSSSDSGDSIKAATVGIIAQGTPRNLHLNLFSDPSGMSEGDILSYIMLGRSQDRVTAAQAALLLQAIATTNSDSSETNDIGKKLQDTLGLDELTFEDNPQIDPETNQAEDNTSLVIGKSLTKKISLQLSMGLLVPVNAMRLVYKMTDRISAQAEASSVEQGADVFYTIEK